MRGIDMNIEKTTRYRIEQTDDYFEIDCVGNITASFDGQDVELTTNKSADMPLYLKAVIEICGLLLKEFPGE
jgi:hypothetical protein